jgi:predicted RNase H-like HicB family nuclease
MRNFTAVVFFDPLGRYIAEFPDLAGCIASSLTIDALPAAAADVLCACLDEMMLNGENIPEAQPFQTIAADPRNEGRIGAFSVSWPAP